MAVKLSEQASALASTSVPRATGKDPKENVHEIPPEIFYSPKQILKSDLQKTTSANPTKTIRPGGRQYMRERCIKEML